MPTTKKPTTKKVAVKKAEKTAEDKGGIHLVVSTKGQVFETDTDNVAAFILGLGIANTNTKTVITATFNGKTVDNVFFTAQAKMLFNNKLRAEVFEKNLKLALNAN